MCGKFTQMMSWGAYVELADLIGNSARAAETVTPMRFATIIRLNGEGKREAARMRWGLVPPRAKDPNRANFIHARAESIEERPTYRDAFFNRRGLLIVKTFNEGKEITPTKTEQHTITPNDGNPIAIAVIWERWGEPHGGMLETFAMVTVPPNALIGTITDRMPAVIPPDQWGKWLGEELADIQELKAMLAPFEGDWTMAAAPKPSRARPPRPNDPQGQPPLL
jgi:putative SOS response-associated peptidase YedK